MRNVIITGVSGGLGAALFDQMHGQGDRIIAIGRRFTDRQRALAAEDAGRVVLREADLTDAARIPPADELAALLAPGAGSPAVLIHNAGVIEPIGAIGTLAAEQISRAVAVNLTAVMILTNDFLAATARAPAVRVLFISSGAAHHVVEGWSAYCATKAGGEMFMNVLAAQVAGDPRVSVESVNPGVMDTPMQAAVRAAKADYFPARSRYVGLHERGELPSPADVAGKLIAEHLQS